MVSPASTLKIQMQDLGLTDEQVTDMVRLAAPFTHPLGNARYENYLLKFEDGKLTKIFQLDPERETPYDAIYDEEFEGGGRSYVCIDCLGTGEIGGRDCDACLASGYVF